MKTEIIVYFAVGAICVLICGIIMRIKLKGALKLLLNTATGALLITLICVFTPLPVQLNPLSALTVGILGLPGAALIIVISCFL